MAEGKEHIEEKITKRLRERQKNKEFKDTSTVTYTRKYSAAYEIITSRDLDDIEKDNVMAYKLIEKSKIWPLYNVNELREQGNSSGAAYIKVKCRESLSAKPLDKKEAREVYVKSVEGLRNELEPLRTVDSIKTYLNNFADIEKFDLGAVPGTENTQSYYQRKARIKYWEDIFGKKFYNFCKAHSDSAKKTFVEAMLYEASPGDELNQTVRIKEIRKSNYERAKSDYDEISKMDSEQLYKHVLTKWTGVPNTFQKFKNDIYRNEKHYRDLYKSKLEQFEKSLESPIVINPIYKKRDDDWSWAEQKSDKGKEKIDEEGKPVRPQNIFQKYGVEEPKVMKRKPLDYIKRTGGLPVGDLGTKAVIENFGFKNIVYGNYVNDAESKEHTRHILGSMLDLVEICNIDIRDINKLGGLDINIGSTGCGSFSTASACYFPSLKAINITKTKGDGTIAHEWSHYLDNVLSELSEKRATGITHASDIGNTKEKINLKSERVATLFLELNNWMKSSGGERAIKLKFYPQSKFHYLLHGNVVDEAVKYIQSRHPNYAKYENSGLPDVYKYYGWIAHKLNNGNPIEVELKTNYSDFWVKSSMYSPPAYYTKPAELFARAFEAWVEYKMKKSDRVNNYLADIVSSMGIYALIIPRSEWPYPNDREMEFINDWIERLFSAIRVDYGIKPFSWNTVERVDEYTEYKDKKGKTEVAVVVGEDGETMIIDDDIDEFEKGFGFRMEKVKDKNNTDRIAHYLLTSPYSRGRGFALGGEKSNVFIVSLKYFTEKESGFGVCDGILQSGEPNIVIKLNTKKINDVKKEAVEYYKSKDMKKMTRDPQGDKNRQGISLNGATIFRARYLVEPEAKAWIWNKSGLVLLVKSKDGEQYNIFAMADAEGNDAGAVFMDKGGFPTISLGRKGASDIFDKWNARAKVLEGLTIVSFGHEEIKLSNGATLRVMSDDEGNDIGFFAIGISEIDKDTESESSKSNDRPAPESKSRFSPVREIRRSEITTMPELFQGRQHPYSEESVSKIVSEGFDKSNDPIIVWFDEEKKKYIVISGHSRWEAGKRLYDAGDKSLETMPVKVFLGDKEEAVSYAVLESNRASTQEGFVSDVVAVRKMMAEGYNKADMGKYIKPSSYLEKLISYTYLNPKGKFIEYLDSPSKVSFPYLERNAQWVGDLRKMYGQKLSNSHESELFDYFYTGGSQKSLTVKKADFFNIIDKKVQAIDWNPELPLNMHSFALTSSLTNPVKTIIDQKEGEIKELEAEIGKKTTLVARAKHESMPELEEKFNSDITANTQRVIMLKGEVAKLKSDMAKLEKQTVVDLFSQIPQKSTPVKSIEAEIMKQESDEAAGKAVMELTESVAECYIELIDFAKRIGKSVLSKGSEITILGYDYTVNSINADGIEFSEIVGKMNSPKQPVKFTYNELADWFMRSKIGFDGYVAPGDNDFYFMLTNLQLCAIRTEQLNDIRIVANKSAQQIAAMAEVAKELQAEVEAYRKIMAEREREVENERLKSQVKPLKQKSSSRVKELRTQHESAANRKRKLARSMEMEIEILEME